MIDAKSDMILESLRKNILTKFGTLGFEALEAVAKDPVFVNDWQKQTVQEIRQWAHAELEPFWLAALLSEPERLV